MNRPLKIADSLVDRLSHGHDRHGQRWHLHLPSEGESAGQVRPLLVLLGLPTFGLAFAISVLTTYGPVILIHLTHSPAVVGALIGGEGAFALVVPLAAGSVSDRLPPSPLGRRFPFVLAGAPMAATALALLPFSFTTGLAGAAVLAFFVGYYIYYPRTARSMPICCRARSMPGRRRDRQSPAAPASGSRYWPADSCSGSGSRFRS
jgi:MFS family permease